jgi:hypothetical protein
MYSVQSLQYFIYSSAKYWYKIVLGKNDLRRTPQMLIGEYGVSRIRV